MRKSKTLLSLVSVLGIGVIGGSSAFAATANNTNESKNTDVSVTLQAPSNPTNPTPPQPDGPNQGGNSNNTNNNVNGTFGLAYQPTAFSFTTDQLKSTGEQVIPVSNPHNSTFNVGVKDMTHDTRGWTLKVGLNWTGNKSVAGATIETTNATGAVNKNINTGGDFDAATNLVPVTSGVTGAQNYSINTAPGTIMTGQDGVVHNAVYDYNLGNVSLKIPDTTNVVATTYQAQVKWDLELTP